MTHKLRSKDIIVFILIFVCFERLLETLGFPHSAVFLLDLLNLILFLNLIVGNKIVRLLKLNIIRWHMLLILIGIIIATLHAIHIPLVIWSLRNLGRFYIFFGACVFYLKENDYKRIFSLLEKVLYIDSVLIAIQYVMGYRGDFLGGVFGNATGANAYSNALFVVVCGYSISGMLGGKKATIKGILPVALSLLISIVTETKVFLFELPIIIILNVLIIGIIERKYAVFFKGIMIGVLVIVAVIVGSKYIAQLYPNLSNSNFMSVEGLRYILTRESGYSGSGDLNRLTAIQSLNKLGEFNESILHRVFGLGLGSAEYSGNVSFLQSTFYQHYNSLHYYWFSHAWMYIECGYFGLITYVLGFYAGFPEGIKTIRKRKAMGADSTMIISGLVTCGISGLLLIYNQSLRIEPAFLFFFSISAIYAGGGLLDGKRAAIGKYYRSDI